MDEREELKEILKSKSVLRGEFTLVSGKKSNIYINGKLTSLNSRGLYLAAKLLLDMFDGMEYDAFAGPSIGADPIIGALLTLSSQKGEEKEGLLIRKEPKGHGTKSLIEGNIKEGMKVLLLEDVTTTGGSLLRAADAVSSEGGEIVGIFAIVDREEGASERLAGAGYTFASLFKLHELL